jgi:hypothetical protein
MKIEIKQVKPWRLFHCTFENQYELCMTFVRIQEFYESPKFRNKGFTLEEYIDWFCSEQSEDGSFTYMVDWNGFNVPSDVLLKAYKDLAWTLGGLRPREKSLQDALYKKAKIDIDHDSEEPFYIIGTAKGCDIETVAHEVRHGLYYLDRGYRREMKAAIERCRLLGLKKRLIHLGYHRAVLTDECHAYILTGLEDDMKETKEIRELRKKLKVIEKKYIGG